jgi:hypothetical protein
MADYIDSSLWSQKLASCLVNETRAFLPLAGSSQAGYGKGKESPRIGNGMRLVPVLYRRASSRHAFREETLGETLWSHFKQIVSFIQ